MCMYINTNIKGTWANIMHTLKSLDSLIEIWQQNLIGRDNISFKNLQVVCVIDCYFREASPVRCCCENFSSDIQTISLRWFHKQNLIYTDVTNTVKMCVSVLTVTLDKLHQLLKVLKLFSWTKNINVKPRWLYRQTMILYSMMGS